ncbi:MAG: uroporphyrinogen decarboxylase family protein [Mahellales bacterium]|jgi:uroporphyrinogen decarboxylase
MNSKERVYMALNHEEPDRVPINFRATDQIIDVLYNHYGKDYYQLLDHFNVDFREVIPDYIGPALKKLDDGTQLDIWGVGRKEVITATSRDVCVNVNPLKDINDVDELNKYNWPSIDMFDFSVVDRKCDEFKGYAISTEGIHAEGYHGVFHILTYLFGMERVMMDLVLNEELIQGAIKHIMSFFLKYYEKIFQQAKGKIDFLFYKDDFGTQNSLLISRDFFLKFFAPTLKQLVDLANSYNVKMILHSCGSVIELIPDFIDIGIKVLDPIQTSAKGMDIKVLKERFGDKLTFHGAIDTQKLLPKSSPEQVKEVVRNTIDILGKGGGYFFSPSHRIQQDTPLENVIAMYETANNCPL